MSLLAMFRRDEFDDIPAHCYPADDTLRTISDYWQTCIPSYLALVSTLLGSCSIVAWLFAQLPQIYKNFKIRSTAGLSAYFLVVWCLGDTSNLVGALLTGQATWQVIVASYYSFVDCVLVGQYIWYDVMGRGRKRRTVLLVNGSAAGAGSAAGGGGGVTGGSRSTGEREPLLGSHSNGSANGGSGNKIRSNVSAVGDGGPDGFKFPALVNEDPQAKDSTTVASAARRQVRTARPTGSITASPNAVLIVACLCIALGRASPVAVPSNDYGSSFSALSGSGTVRIAREDGKELAGRIISWASTLLYLVSRFPQLIKNYRRKSTAGLSPVLFAAAFCGNLFYSSSMLTNPLAWGSYGPYGHDGWAGPEGSDQAEWIFSALPFFLGAAGVLALDAAVGVQFMMYGKGRKRVPILIETPPTRGPEDTIASRDVPAIADATGSRQSRILNVPQGGVHADQQQRHLFQQEQQEQERQERLQQQQQGGQQGRPGGLGAPQLGQEIETGSWRRVSGYMRGWVPSFSPGSWSRNGYMASAAVVGRAAKDRFGGVGGANITGIAGSRTAGNSTPRSRSSSSSGGGGGGGGGARKGPGDIRAEAEAWESRQGTRQGTRQGSIADGEGGEASDEDRPLLERDADRYGSL